MDITAFHLLAFAAIFGLAALLSLVHFEPEFACRISDDLPAHGNHACTALAARLVHSPALRATVAEFRTNGLALSPAESSAIEAACHSMHREAHVLPRGAIANHYPAAARTTDFIGGAATVAMRDHCRRDTAQSRETIGKPVEPQRSACQRTSAHTRCLPVRQRRGQRIPEAT